MLFTEEPVQIQRPVLENGLEYDEIQELLALLQSTDTVSPNSGSQGSSRAVYTIDERKKRRMISNRESAKRSRWRKKRHLENLTAQANQLSVENRELKDRLAFVINHWLHLWRDNERLRSESISLWVRLLDLHRVLAAMQSQPSP